tara:strand:+ start:589 stop:705 length:117 start_codon:yes stop_codon:yes gene_type:complete
MQPAVSADLIWLMEEWQSIREAPSPTVMPASKESMFCM